MRFVLRALNSHSPLIVNGVGAPLQLLHRFYSYLNLPWLQDLEDAPGYRWVYDITTKRHARISQ